ncbi:hypothetical protein [Streptomyces sp. NPDC055036]
MPAPISPHSEWFEAWSGTGFGVVQGSEWFERLVVERLTLPGAFPAEEAGALIGALVERLLPPA